MRVEHWSKDTIYLIYKMIIGYSVLYINNKITLKDILWERRVVHSTWEGALRMAYLKSDEEKKKNNDIQVIALINSKSRESCEKNGSTQVFAFNLKSLGEVGNIYIVPVFDE